MAVDRLHSLVATGQFLAAYREVERLTLDPELDPAIKAKVYIAGVRAAAGLREIYAAAKLAERAIEAAELGSDWDDIGNARLYSALIYRELGDTALALRFFRLFFQHLDRYPALQAKTAHAYYNMALTHQQRRDYTEALEAYRLAAEDFNKLQHKAGVLACLHNSAWVLLQQESVSEAESLLGQAEALLPSVDQPEYQVAHLIVEAFHAKQTGNPTRAMALCEEVFQPGRQGVSERSLAEASWIMAGIALQTQRLEEATIFAQLAVNHALESKEPSIMNLASEVRKNVEVTRNRLRT